MTPATARRRSRWWLTATIASAIVGLALAAVGIDLLTLPLTLAAMWCGINAHNWLGWADGYHARQRDEAKREGA